MKSRWSGTRYRVAGCTIAGSSFVAARPKRCPAAGWKVLKVTVLGWMSSSIPRWTSAAAIASAN